MPRGKRKKQSPSHDRSRTRNDSADNHHRKKRRRHESPSASPAPSPISEVTEQSARSQSPEKRASTSSVESYRRKKPVRKR